MRIILTNGKNILKEDFPKKPPELLDMLDRLHQTGNRTVSFEFDCYYEKITPPSKLTEREFRADIFVLNAFTERLSAMTPAERAVYQAVVQKNPVFCFEEALQMTFGLESVPVIKASCFSELGEFVIENDMIPEVRSCPDELVQFLDRAKIGRLMTEEYGGVFIGDYYCEPEAYKKPDIQIKIGEPKHCTFRLLLTSDADRPELAGWISLPCDASELENKVCLDYQSCLPGLLLAATLFCHVRLLSVLSAGTADFSAFGTGRNHGSEPDGRTPRRTESAGIYKAESRHGVYRSAKYRRSI